MKIVADENIPYVKEVFSHLGEITTLSGRAMNRDNVADAELLLVRSITRVNAGLLDDSKVRFVATATIGFDHVDVKYLKDHDIRFASAPGSNATSVAEYMVSALFNLAKRHGFRLRDKSIGIIGVGNVGSRVAARCQALGMKVKLNDPPLAEATRDPKYLELRELMDCDILTTHVPLVKEGPHPTRKMVNAEFLKKTRRGLIYINTSRGEVVEEAVLREAVMQGHVMAAVLDVWENEPDIDADLVERAAISTPHIAGYSFDGKVRGTEMIYRAAVDFLGAESMWRLSLPPPPVPEIVFTQDMRDDEECAAAAVMAVYDVMNDSLSLKRIKGMEKAVRGPYFDRLRKEYPVRREFANTRVRLKKQTARLAQLLRSLEFLV